MKTSDQNGWNANLTSHLPPNSAADEGVRPTTSRRQFGRYLLVGAWNTAFGYGTYALFTALLNPIVPHSYMWASLLSSLLNITVAFLGYKWFVFRTRGNYLREWVRCVAVYSGGIVFGIVALPVLVMLIRHNTRFLAEAPYIAGALVTFFVVAYSFFGHKHFSFRSPV